MSEHNGPTEERPHAPQGEHKGLIHDLAVGAAGSGVWKGAEVIGGRIIGHLRPGSQPPSDVPPSDVPPPSAPTETP
jgi:hypothetical protein